ncbi:MAG: AAA family ATPase, partial [Fusobacteriaceae bacterium]
IFLQIKNKFYIEDFEFDILMIKKLAGSNTLHESNSNQTHIAITGEQMDVFPYLENYGHLVDGKKDFKKRFLLRIPVFLSGNNLKYLNNEIYNSQETSIDTYTHFNKSRRTAGSFQGEISYLKFEDNNFIDNFRKKIEPNDYLVIIKEKEKFKYLFIGLKKLDAETIIKNKSSLVYFDEVNPGTGKNVTLIVEDNIVEILESETFSLDKPHQKIVYGAPGTGKSYSLDKEVKENFLISEKRTISTSERVTFYDGYTYGQFVGAYKPVPVTGISEEEKDISYEYVPGPMIKLLEKAYNHPNENFVLVIEEINRARADRVFGNIFQLLDRDKSGKSEYPVSLSEEQQRYFKDKLEQEIYLNTIKEEGGLYLPSNLYIWATMNSADQGVYPMDSAFKRRWDFEYIGIDDNADKFGEQTYEYLIALYYTGEKKNKKEDEDPTYQEVKWNNFRKVINDTLLNERVPEDRLLAPFFIKPKDFGIKDTNRENAFWITDEIYESKILMYLFDDVLRHRGKDKIFRRDLRSFSELIREYRAGKSIFNEEITEKMLELEETLELSEKQD